MNITRTTAISMFTVALGFTMPHAFAAEQSQAALLKQAKITEAQAKATVLKKMPHGTVKSSQLEKEHGRLIWSVDVAKPHTKSVSEIQVDAKTGKIASVKKETVAQKAKEAKAKS